MMNNIPFFEFSKILLLVTLFGFESAFSQTSTEFKYYNESLDEFDGVKYENEKKTKETISNEFKILGQFLKNDSLAIREKITIKSILGSVKIFKFYDSNTLLIIDGSLKNINSIDDSLINVLYNLDLQAFLAFYSSKPNTKYPKINTLKVNVKNNKGDLDIEKLAKIIKQNQGALSKYLDQ